MDQFFDPHKYNYYREDSQWMVLKGCAELQMHRIMDRMPDTAAGAMTESDKTKETERSV